MVNGDTLIKTKGKFVALKRLEQKTLLNLYKNGGFSKEVKEYVKENIDKYSHPDYKPESFYFPCEKLTYLTKEEANRIINSINNKNHKVPERSYECQRCGFWHLTSKSKEEYTQLKKQFRDESNKTRN
jgi:hypothetical protein